MKLTPLEAAIERVALRILKRNKKDIDKAINEAYGRAVGQAVEFLKAKTSPAVKANATRKRMAAVQQTLQALHADLVQAVARPEEDYGPSVLMWEQRVGLALEQLAKGGEA